MRTRLLVHHLLSLLISVSLLLTPAVPTVQATGTQANSLRYGQDTGPATPTAPDPSPQPPSAQSGQDAPAAIQTANRTQQALREGKWPAQIASGTGGAQPDQHGPQRNDPAEGIPTHAYSPFDERANREYPCPPNGCNYEPGEVLVKLAPAIQPRSAQETGAWTSDAQLNRALAEQEIAQLTPLFPTAKAPRAGEVVVTADGDVLPKPDLTRWYKATLRSRSADVFAAVEWLAATPGVAMAEPNYQRRLADDGAVGSPGAEPTGPGLATAEQSATTGAAAFSDPLYSQQWHLAAANIPAAWDYLTSQGLPAGGNRGIVVAVIDTGVDYTHPDLAVNMWTNSREIAANGIDDDGNGFVDDIHGVTVVSNQPSGDPMDDHGHGTHVAGIIAAQAGNNRGGVGVAYNVQILAIKAAQYSGVLSSSDIAQALYYAVQQGADVVNMSFGGYARSQLEEDALAVAFGQAVLVAAAGNDGKVNLPCPGGRDMYPAAYNWVLGVMASAPGGGRAGFSNYDCTPHDSHEYELLAPGVDVWSSLPFEQYAAWDGTSMATPVVAGIAALARTKWADKNLYSSRFIMGQIASNASPVANALAALTVAPRPELTYLEHWLFDTTAQAAVNDNDGIVDAGETIDLAVVIRNHWGKADNVSVKLEAWAEGAVQADPYVTMITSTVSYGAVGSFNSDDNGLIYDAQGVITGVRSPFRFSVSPNTPNDHLIPFRLTMTAKNGYAPSDPTLTFVSRFFLLVQRGRELPRIISQDIVLTKNDYWIISGPTLITTGSVVTITEGTQLQWGSSVPNNPYADPALPYIQVEGVLRTKGSFAEPVELYPSPLAGGQTYVRNFGQASFQYVKIQNPQFGQNASFGVNDVDHAFVNADGTVATPDLPFWGFATASLTNSILFKIQTITQDHNFSPGFADTNLFDASWIGQGYMDDIWHWSSWGVSSIKNSVFLQDNTHLIATRWLVTDHSFNNPSDASAYSPHRNNAFLSSYWNPNIRTWMRFGPKPFLGGNSYIGMAHNYWGTQFTAFIDSAIFDYDDTFNDAHIVYQPILTTPVTTTYPFAGRSVKLDKKRENEDTRLL